MNWLFKEEPTYYSYDELTRDGKTSWTGVRNPLAQKHLRAVHKGDRIFFYHTGDEKSVVGVMKAAANACPGPGGRDRQALWRRGDAGAQVEAAGQAVGDQGRHVVRGLRAGPHVAAVGDAGDRRAVGADRGDEQDLGS